MAVVATSGIRWHSLEPRK